MLLDFISIYFFISIVASVFVIMYLLTNTKTSNSLTLAVLTAFIVIYIYGYMMELNSTSLERALFWSRFQYIGIPFINATWLFLGVLYIKENKKQIIKLFILIYTIPIITFFIRMTNNMHHLYYKDYALINKFGLYLLNIDKGSWYMVNTLYFITSTITIIIIFYVRYNTSSPEERKMFRALFVLTVAPVLGLMLQIANPGDLSLDYNAFVVPIAVVCITLFIIRNNFLEVKSLGRTEIFMNSNVAICIISRNNRIVDYNNKAVELFNSQGLDISKVSLSEEESSSKFLELIKKSEKSPQLYFDGDGRYWEIENQIITQKNIVSGRILKITDETEKIQIQKHLEHLSITDPLSDLKNRREFIRIGKQLITLYQENKVNITLMMIDIDYFKRINDKYGHLEGDKVIQSISDMLKKSFRSTDLVSRFGGEEFAVILNNVQEKEAVKMAEELRKKVETEKFVDLEVDFSVTMSIGIAGIEEKDDLKSLIKKADKSLYSAKDTGRNKVVTWSEIKENIKN